MTQRPSNRQSQIKDILNQDLSRLENILQADVLTIFGPILPGLEKIIKESIERIQNHRDRIAIVLDTVGGIVDDATIENNPKIDAQLISDFYRLVDASQGVIRGGRGANYSLSHPLDSKVVATDDPRQNEEDLKEVKKTRT